MPVHANTCDPDTFVVNAWLLSERGIEKRKAQDFVRFVAVHSGQHLRSETRPPPAKGVFNNRPSHTHTIGLAAFAPIQNLEAIYLEFIWGGTFGRGSEYRFDAKMNFLECLRNLWLS
jgi:hypothetical protein